MWTGWIIYCGMPILRGASYGKFDLTRILRVIRPIENGIAFQQNGMHAVEDYVVSRYQMYMQVYFHPATVPWKSSFKIFSNELEPFIQIRKSIFN